MLDMSVGLQFEIQDLPVLQIGTTTTDLSTLGQIDLSIHKFKMYSMRVDIVLRVLVSLSSILQDLSFILFII